jgi:hypothetical protein
MSNLQTLITHGVTTDDTFEEAVLASTSLVEWNIPNADFQDPGNNSWPENDAGRIIDVFNRNRLWNDARQFCGRLHSQAAVVQKLAEIERAGLDLSISVTYEVVRRALLPHLIDRA